MRRLENQIVLITGASSGIGEACAEQLAASGARLILAARRVERLTELADRLRATYQTSVLTFNLDVRDRAAVDQMMAALPADWQTVDVLVNNAGLSLTLDKMQDADPANWDTMIDTNIKGLLYVTHAVLPGMVARNRGHIINIGSIAGHECYSGGNIYSATKFAVKSLTKSLLLDLLGTAVRATSIDPGAVATEFSTVRWNDPQRAKAFYDSFVPLQAADIADAVVYCATRPPHVKIAEMIIMGTDQASANHIHIENKLHDIAAAHERNVASTDSAD